MFVYFIQQANGGPIKIGCAADPGARLAQIQTANPNDVVILAVCRGSRAAERAVQEHFADARIIRNRSSEWFEATPDLLTMIAKLPSWESVRDGGDCPSIVPRKDAVQRLRRVGYSLQEIGDHYGFTRQRAHQLASGPEFDFRKPPYRELIDAPDRPPIAEYIEANPHLFSTTVEIALVDEN